MKKTVKYILVFSAFSFQLLAFNLAAKADEDIYTEPLFTDDQVYYKPFSSRSVEEEKVRAMQNGDRDAMYVIGMMYRDGTNVDADVVQALEWFKNAAQRGNSNAMVELSRIYSLDKEFTGIERNDIEAIRWIREAEKRNNPKALYTLGLMYEEGFPFDRSYEESFSYFKKAAYRGVLNAYVKMYIAYQYGKGVDPDLKKAIYWLNKIMKEAPTASKPSEYAKQMLSDIYFELGLKEEDPTLKFKLFQLAWSFGNRYANEAMGDMFFSGVGVKQSFSSAIVAYETAIKNFESVYAMERLGYIYLKGPGEITRDYNKAMDLFKKAADLGGVYAAYMVGHMYFYGFGVDQNAAEAKVWFARSEQLASKRKVDESKKRISNQKSESDLKKLFSDTAIKAKEMERNKKIEQQIRDIRNNGGNAATMPDAPKY
jgi:TPR repeat protein